MARFGGPRIAAPEELIWELVDAGMVPGIYIPAVTGEPTYPGIKALVDEFVAEHYPPPPPEPVLEQLPPPETPPVPEPLPPQPELVPIENVEVNNPEGIIIEEGVYQVPPPPPGEIYEVVTAPSGEVYVESPGGEGFSEPLERYRVEPAPPEELPPPPPPSTPSESRVGEPAPQPEPQEFPTPAAAVFPTDVWPPRPPGRQVPSGRSRERPSSAMGATIPGMRVPPRIPLPEPAPPVEPPVPLPRPPVFRTRPKQVVEPDYRRQAERMKRDTEIRKRGVVIEGEREVPAPSPIGTKKRGPFGTEEQGRVIIVGRGETPRERRRREGVRVRPRVIVTAPQPLPPPPRPSMPTPPAPVPVPMPPRVEIPHPEVPAPPPISSPGPVQTPAPTGMGAPSPVSTPTSSGSPVGIAAAAALAGLAALLVHQPRSKLTVRSQTVTPTTTATPTSTPAPVPTPVGTPAISPAPAPAPAAPAPPAPPLTSVMTAGVGSRCTPDAESCRRAKEQRKRERDAKCKAFIKVPVRAHKKSVCVQDLAKYLFRKFKSKAVREVKAELKKHGIEMIKRPRRPKLPDIELGGGIEIDTGDLLRK